MPLACSCEVAAGVKARVVCLPLMTSFVAAGELPCVEAGVLEGVLVLDELLLAPHSAARTTTIPTTTAFGWPSISTTSECAYRSARSSPKSDDLLYRRVMESAARPSGSA